MAEEAKKVDKRPRFEELYKEFVKKCLNENILPSAALGNDMRTIYAYISFVEVSDEDKKKMLSSI